MSTRYSNFSIFFVFPLKVVLRFLHNRRMIVNQNAVYQTAYHGVVRHEQWDSHTNHKNTNFLQLFCIDRVMELVTLLYFAINTLVRSLATCLLPTSFYLLNKTAKWSDWSRLRPLEPVVCGTKLSPHTFSPHTFYNVPFYQIGSGCYGINHSGECR